MSVMMALADFRVELTVDVAASRWYRPICPNACA